MACQNGFRRKKILPLRKSDANTYFRGIRSRVILAVIARTLHNAPVRALRCYVSRSGCNPWETARACARLPRHPLILVHEDVIRLKLDSVLPSFRGQISSWPNLLTERYSIWLHGNAGVKFDSALVSWLSLKFQGTALRVKISWYRERKIVIRIGHSAFRFWNLIGFLYSCLNLFIQN